MEAESIEAAQARHRKELKDLQSRITSKKKNATKKTRKGVNDECAELERQTRERHDQELALLRGEANNDDVVDDSDEEDASPKNDSANGVATKLAETTISDTKSQTPGPPASQPAPETAAGNGGGGNKKRNRQKERLARRAAEREADSERAETEASQMTDHREIEREALEKSFKAYGRELKEIAPDGHCLFSAVADQLGLQGIPLSNTEQQQPSYKMVRRVATDYMLEHGDDFAPFLMSEDGTMEDLDSYAAKMRDTAEWGGNLELMALANGYGVTIKVVQEGRTETITPTDAEAGGGEEGGDRKEVWLAYYRHGYGLGEHYNSLRPAR